MSNIEVKKEFICLPQFPTDPDNCDQFCDCPSGCTCVAAPLPLCYSFPLIISNADIEIQELANEGLSIIPRPSEVLQYSIISSPCPGQIEVRTFRFLCIENVNKDRFLIQSRNTDGILECREVFFADKDKRTCKKKCC